MAYPRLYAARTIVRHHDTEGTGGNEYFRLKEMEDTARAAESEAEKQDATDRFYRRNPNAWERQAWRDYLA
jgi:hypothetical protein